MVPKKLHGNTLVVDRACGNASSHACEEPKQLWDMNLITTSKLGTYFDLSRSEAWRFAAGWTKMTKKCMSE